MLTDAQVNNYCQSMRNRTFDQNRLLELFPEIWQNLQGRNDVPLEDDNPNNWWMNLAHYCLDVSPKDFARNAYTGWYEKMIQREATQSQRSIHKGTPLHNLGVIHLLEQRHPYALRYFLLAIIEDMWGAPAGYRNRPAYRILKTIFLLSEDEFDTLSGIAGRQDDKRFPECVLLSFQLGPEGRLVRPVKGVFPINSPMATEMLRDAEQEQKADAKGKKFEDLMAYLFSTVDGYEIAGIRKWSEKKEFEYDFIVRNLISDDPVFAEFGKYLVVECKHWNTKVSVSDLHHFISKVRTHDCQCGVLVSAQRIPKGDENLTVLKAYHGDGIIILTITLDEVKAVVEGRKNLLTLLLNEYERIRFDLPR